MVKVIIDAVIYTVDGADWNTRPAEAMAIDASGRILLVGNKKEVIAAAKSSIKKNLHEPEIIPMGGKTILPGFIDSHVHIPGDSLTEMFGIYLAKTRNKKDTLQAITDFVRTHPEKDIYFGSGFLMGIGPDQRGPKREWLDAIVSDKPVILSSTDGHNIWLNSKGFEYFGITNETHIPQGGYISVDENTGEFWGIVTDAFELITQTEDKYSREQQIEALEDFQHKMLNWGYTSAMFIAPHSVDCEALREFDRSGKLVMKANMSVCTEPGSGFESIYKQMKAMEALFSDSKNIKPATVKYFADGVVEGMTAYLSEAYEPGLHPDPGYRSELIWDKKKLAGHFQKTIENGWQIHVHTIGDAATEEVLDAIESARKSANISGRDNSKYDSKCDSKYIGRDVLTHLQLVKEHDIARMAELDIVAAHQPFWHMKEPGWYEYIDKPILGESRALDCYPVGRNAKSGSKITFSGDYPVSSENNPFWAICAAVTRNLYAPTHYGVEAITDSNHEKWLRNPNERISIKEAIEAYTINGAYQLFRENEIGSLAAGKQADFIVVNENPMKTPDHEIYRLYATETWIAGEKV